MLDSIRRLTQTNRKEIIKEKVIYWLSDKWQSKGLIHDFVMTCHEIEPWVTQKEVDDVLSELELSGLAKSAELPIVDIIPKHTTTFWKNES